MSPFQITFFQTLACSALILLGGACGGSTDPSAPNAGAGAGGAPVQAGDLEIPTVLTWELLESDQPIGDLRVGPALFSDAELRFALLNLRKTYRGFGPCMLLWQLLDGGYGATAVLHGEFPDESEAARQLALAAHARIQTSGDFFAELQANGDEVAPDLKSPSPVDFDGLGASVAAGLEAGQWSSPYRSIEGWEILYLEERIPGSRMRSGVSIRRLLFPVADLAARDQARQSWVKLPIAGSELLIRSLPANFRLGRVTESS